MLVELKEVFVELKFHLEHGVFKGFGFKLAFPNGDDMPSIIA